MKPKMALVWRLFGLISMALLSGGALAGGPLAADHIDESSSEITYRP